MLSLITYITLLRILQNVVRVVCVVMYNNIIIQHDRPKVHSQLHFLLLYYYNMYYYYGGAISALLRIGTYYFIIIIIVVLSGACV